jgi:hypothetical protein
MGLRCSPMKYMEFRLVAREKAMNEKWFSSRRVLRSAD